MRLLGRHKQARHKKFRGVVMGRKRAGSTAHGGPDAPADDSPDASDPPGGDTGDDAEPPAFPGSANEDNEGPPAPAAPPPSGLAPGDELIKRLLELLTNGNGGAGFSKADRRTILHLLRLAQRCKPEDKIPRTCGDVDDLLAELLRKSPEERWELKMVSVPGFGGLPPLNVYVRPLDAVLRHLVATLPIRWGFWGYDTVGDDDDKQRVYDHPCSGRLYEVLEAVVRGVGADALPCELWSDKVAPFKWGTQSYYPLSVVVLSVSYDDIRKQWPRSHVAMLPVLENNAPVYSHMTADDFRFYKAAAHAAVTSVVLYPAFDKTYRLMCTDEQGSERVVAPVFMYYVADHQEAEAANAALSKQFSLQVDLDIGKNAPPPMLRTADRLEAALEAMRLDDDAGGRAAPSERQKKESKLQGVESTMLTLLRRSWLSMLPPDVIKAAPWLMVPAFYTPADALHVHDEGLIKYFFQVRSAAPARTHCPPDAVAHSRTQKCLYQHSFRLHGPARARQLMRSAEARQAYIRLNAFIENFPLPSESKLFLTSREGDKSSLPCSGLMGKELRAAMQIVVHLLHGLLDPAPAREDDYLEEVGVTMLTAYAKLKRYNCEHGHTDETLEELGPLLLRCHSLVLKKETFLQDGPNKANRKWWMPKAWLGWAGAAEPHCIIQNWIKWFGHPAATSTDWGENSAKTTNAAARATNKNKGTMVVQMVTALAEKAVAARSLEEAGLSAAPPTLGTAETPMQRAKRLGEPCFPKNAKATIPLSSLESNPVPGEYNTILRYRDGMSKLRGELSRLLGQPVDPESVVEVVNFAVIMGRPLHREGAIAYQVLYATPAYRGQRRFSWVAVDGGQGQEWYGQIQLLFKHNGHNYAYLKYVIPETDAKLLGGALLNTPGCGLFQWEGTFGVVDVGEHTEIIRREVFIPDVSELYAPGVTAPAAKKRAAAQQDKGKQKTGAKKQKGAPKVPAAAANKTPNAAAKKKKKKKKEADSDHETPDDEPGDCDTEAPQTQPAKAANSAPGFTVTRWIRTQLVWGFDGGRPMHEVDEDVEEAGEE